MIETYGGYDIYNPDQVITAAETVSILKQRKTEADKPHPAEIILPTDFQKALSLAQKHAQADFVQTAPQLATTDTGTRTKILPAEVYSELLHRPKGSVGAYHNIDQIVYLVPHQVLIRHPFLMYQFSLHEEIHRRAKTIYQAKKYPSGEVDVNVYQAGYYTQENRNGPGGNYRFFDEGITERNKWAIAIKNIDELEKELKFDRNNAPTNTMYQGFLAVTTKLIMACSKLNPDSDFDFKMKSGIYTGDRSHLALVDQTFGEQSLQILATMGESEYDINNFNNELYLRYFSTEASTDERNGLRNTFHL